MPGPVCSPLLTVQSLFGLDIANLLLGFCANLTSFRCNGQSTRSGATVFASNSTAASSGEVAHPHQFRAPIASAGPSLPDNLAVEPDSAVSATEHVESCSEEAEYSRVF